MNPNVNAFQRNFVNEVKRCDEMERKLRFLREYVRKEEALLRPGETLLSVTGADPSAHQQQQQQHAAAASAAAEMDELEGQLDTHERELRHMNQSQETLARNFNELLEMMFVLTKDAAFFEESAEGEPAAAAASSSSAAATEETSAPLLGDESGSSSSSSRRGAGRTKLEFLTGVVLKSRVVHFQRVLWRALHGNLYQRTSDIEEALTDPASGDRVEKAVFIVFFHGEQSLLKIRKICEAFGARICPCPDTRQMRMELLGQVNGRISDMKLVLEHSAEHRRRLLAVVSAHLQAWTAFVRKEKAIYHVMNLCNYDVGRRCLVAEGWCPANSTDEILEALNRGTKSSGTQANSILSFVRTKEEPPTYFPVTPFTSCFHTIVEAYGVARYGEVNPAVLSVITFPFLFAIMFGDAGHALLLLGFALLLLKFYPKLQGKKNNEIVDMMLTGRYLLLLMALFSLYTGLLYNEVFCVPLSIFKGSYTNPLTGGACVAGQPCKKTGATYPFGIDPVWRAADNELFIYNSLKMKMSIVFGVVQMIVGVVMSLFNYLHFHKPLDIIFCFVPQMLFMLCTFGYLTFLIFFKWLSPSVNSDAPYLINVIIDSYLKFGSLPPEEKLFNGQNGIQMVFAVVAILSAITMLLPKPFILRYLHKRRMAQRMHGGVSASSSLIMHEEEEEVDASGGYQQSGVVGSTPGAVREDPETSDDFKFGEVFVHTAIHSIEYILGCISNTASYLRLWALSLAHSQLSVVFYEQIFVLGLGMGNFAVMFVCFAVWGGATLGILLGMEALSAFLHALRLHWVEYMNKFYQGDGELFVPFSFATNPEDEE